MDKFVAKVSRLFPYFKLTLRSFKDIEKLLIQAAPLLIEVVGLCPVTKHYGFSLTQNLLAHIHFKVIVTSQAFRKHLILI